MLLDRFGEIAVEAVASAYETWKATTAKLAELEADEQDRLRMADLWRFQAKEIDQAGLTVEDEDAKLEAEKRVLWRTPERLYTAAMSAHELLYESENAAETTLGAALKHLEELARFDPRFTGTGTATGGGEGDCGRRGRRGAGVCRECERFAGTAGGDRRQAGGA